MWTMAIRRGSLQRINQRNGMNYMNNVADGKEEEKNLPILFANGEAREKFKFMIKGKEFKKVIEGFRDGDEIFESESLEEKKNKDEYTWPIVVENKGANGRKKREHFVICFETNDDDKATLKVERGDIKVVPVEKYPLSTWTKWAHADFVFRPGNPYELEEKKMVKQHPHQKLYEWFLKNTDDLFYLKPMEITNRSYEQLVKS